MLGSALVATVQGGAGVPGLIGLAGNSVYFFEGLLAIWGIYNALLLYRGLRKKRLAPTQASVFLAQLQEHVGGTKPNVGAALSLCQNPPYWHTALGQLVGVALSHRDRGLARIKQLLVMEFHTEVVAAMENRLASLATAAKLAPLLGLLGTVLGMIAAFGRMGEGERADAGSLAAAISLSLWTTAIGLIIASPLLMMGNDVQGKLRRLRDQTERQLGDFLDILESRPGSSTAPARAGAGRSVLPPR